MTRGPVNKLDKRNTATSKKFADDFMSANCDTIAIFSVYGQFGPIRKPDTGCMVYILTFSLIITFYLIKTKNRTKKTRRLSLQKNQMFCKKC